MPEIAVKGIVVDQDTFSKVALVREMGKEKKPPGWGFPGGEGFDEEMAKAALIREIDEETGLSVKILDLLHEEVTTYENEVRVRRLFFLCQALNDGHPKRRVAGETNGWQWFPINKLPQGGPPEGMYFSHRGVLEDIDGNPKKEITSLLWYHRSN